MTSMNTRRLKYSSSKSHKDDLRASEISSAVIRIAVAQICNSVGYLSTQNFALETLTDVAIRYIRSLATSAATSAVSTGRTEGNLLDIVRGLEDLHSVLGFCGNSETKSHLNFLSDSSILRDTMKFVYRSREIPFAKPLPRLRHTVPSNAPCNVSHNDNSKRSHIPRWLPAFPQVEDNREKTIAATMEGEITGEKMFPGKEAGKISKLPAKRKKVSFKIGGRKGIETGFDVDLRSGVCKGGKRISCLMNDDEKIVNFSSNKKLGELSPSMKPIILN